MKKKISWKIDWLYLILGLMLLYIAANGVALMIHYNNPRNVVQYQEGR